MRLIGAVVAGAVLMTASAARLPAAPAGEAVGLSPVARVITGTNPGPLVIGSDIYMGDRISTGVAGEVQVLFRDNTRLVIGPGSELLIDKYVAPPGGTRTRAFAVNAVTGAFRFISGRTAKPNYEIRTPTATIGVRGTSFDFGVRSAGRSYLLLYEGVVRMCGTAGNCRILDEPCELAGTNSRGRVQLSYESQFLPRRNDLRLAFPYQRSEGSLNDDFRLRASRACRGVIQTAPASDSGDRTGNSSDGSPSRSQSP